MARKCRESEEIANGSGDVVGGNRGPGGGQGWFQNVGLDKGNVSGMVVDGVRLMIGRKGIEMPLGKCESLAVIAATAEVKGVLKMMVVVEGVVLGSQPHSKWLAEAENWLDRQWR